MPTRFLRITGTNPQLNLSGTIQMALPSPMADDPEKELGCPSLASRPVSRPGCSRPCAISCENEK
jgi:hypothetical protein